jgi:hypothetical protein
VSGDPERHAAHRDAAHPVVATVALSLTFVTLGMTLGVILAAGGATVLSFGLGAVTVAGSVITFVALLPERRPGEAHDPIADAVEERALEEGSL